MKLFKNISLCIIFVMTVFAPEAYGCSKVVVKQGMDYQTVFSAKNTKYVIKQDINLGGKTVKIGEGSTLVFQGGSFVNGKIICNKTALKGKPIIEDISGSVTNQIFYSSWVTGSDKFSVLCKITANRIVLDEDLTLRSHKNNDFNSAILDGAGHIIRLDYDLLEVSALIRCLDNVKAIKNLHIDFVHHEFHSVALWFTQRTKSLEISNVSFSNLNNASVRKFGFEGIGIFAKESTGSSFKGDMEINISQVSASNMKALTDDSGKDGEATMTIVYVNCDAPVKSRNQLTVNISDCHFKEIVVQNKRGDVVANDAACIYVHQDVASANSRVHIKNIHGYNFGRRLVKTDVSNLLIENIKGESYNGGSFCMVGCNNGGVSHSANNASIRGLTFKGKVSYVVACMVNNSVIKDIDAEFTDYYIRPRVLSGVVFVGDDALCRVENVQVKGKCYLYCSTSQTQVTFSNVNLTSDDSIEGTHYLFSTIGIKSLELSGFRFDIKGSLPTLTTYLNSNPNSPHVDSRIVLRDGTINVLNENGGIVINDYSTRHPYSLLIENVTINQKRGTAPVISISSPTLKKVDIRDIHFSFENTTDAARVINLECNDTGDYSLSNITCDNVFKLSPISISGTPKSKVMVNRIAVKGEMLVKNNVRIMKQ